MPPIPSRFALHVQAWDQCQRCDLHKSRQHVCHLRGRVPCDVLFVGEAPGLGEDALGAPFIGQAGHLLDRIIANALPGPTWCPECGKQCYLCPGGVTCTNGHGGLVSREEYRGAVSFALTNTVGCVPLDEDGTKTTEPPLEALKACAPRLVDLLTICTPQLVVLVGGTARDWVEVPKGVASCEILHPAAILRQPVAAQGMSCRRCEVVIRSAWEAVAEKPGVVY